VPEVDCGVDAVGLEAKDPGADAGEAPATLLDTLLEAVNAMVITLRCAAGFDQGAAEKFVRPDRRAAVDGSERGRQLTVGRRLPAHSPGRRTPCRLRP